MGFHVLAKHGLNKHGLKDPNLASFWDNQKKKTGMKRGEGEKEKKRKRKRGRREEEEIKQKGMETTLSMDFVGITWNLRLDMVNLLSLNLGF